MFSFFAPSYIKEAQLVLKNARKLLHYKKDILSAVSRTDFEAAIERLQKAIKARDRAEVEAAAQQLDKQWSKYLPSPADAAWRENCEVFLVAIVIAIGVRSFFLQPFTIPTGSMQPTLNGIIGHPTDSLPPNVLRQAVDFVLYGRNYVNSVAKADDVVVGLAERKVMFFFTVTDVQCSNGAYTIWAPAETLQRNFYVGAGERLHAGVPIARGYIDAGDHVFVDKLSYNFDGPHRGQVFVFSTRNIAAIERELEGHGVEGSEFYIKRLAGMPLDTLRIDAPLLYVNGQVATEPGFRRVMSRQDGYGGYTNPPPANPYDPSGALYMTTPQDTFTVPAGRYFAMGDNSGNSSDSRYWGTVPPDNLMGRAVFVYWPFLPHWGFVK